MTSTLKIMDRVQIDPINYFEALESPASYPVQNRGNSSSKNGPSSSFK